LAREEFFTLVSAHLNYRTGIGYETASYVEKIQSRWSAYAERRALHYQRPLIKDADGLGGDITPHLDRKQGKRDIFVAYIVT
jgi:hypothetical protein